MTAPLLRTYTLGCKVNQYETELAREGLTQSGYAVAESHQAADLCLINTCTVTAEGDAKSRQIIRRMARQNPHAKLVVMGCYATRAPDAIRALPNVVEVVTDKRELPDLLGRFGVIDFPQGISHFSHRHRAYVKVQDGCLLRCSYCIIPKVRPHMTSRPKEAIVAEVRRLAENGHKEIVLTGIHLGHYGVDGNRNKPKSQWTRLSNLLDEIMKLKLDLRIRLSSIEATEVTKELIQVMSQHPNRICPHLHVCLQSGSDRVLRRMKRRWGAKRFIDRCSLIKETLADPALTTDVIVGFPGETDDDFQATCDVVRAVGFSKVHGFPFSARRGTPAAEMENQIDKQVKSARIAELAAVEKELRHAYFSRLVGQELRVLIESANDDGTSSGTSCRYAPVKLATHAISPGKLIPVQVTGQNADGFLVGVPN